VYAQRSTGRFVEGAEKDAAEAACVETGLESLLILAEMDRQKRRAGTDPVEWIVTPADAGHGFP
jgi:hypothetical protein